MERTIDSSAEPQNAPQARQTAPGEVLSASGATGTAPEKIEAEARRASRVVVSKQVHEALYKYTWLKDRKLRNAVERIVPNVFPAG